MAHAIENCLILKGTPKFVESSDASTSIGPILGGDVAIWLDNNVPFRLGKAINPILLLEYIVGSALEYYH